MNNLLVISNGVLNEFETEQLPPLIFGEFDKQQLTINNTLITKKISLNSVNNYKISLRTNDLLISNYSVAFPPVNPKRLSQLRVNNITTIDDQQVANFEWVNIAGFVKTTFGSGLNNIYYGDGNVGLGPNSSSPCERLEVEGGVKITEAIFLQDGTIQYTSDRGFEGLNKGEWVNFSGYENISEENIYPPKISINNLDINNKSILDLTNVLDKQSLFQHTGDICLGVNERDFFICSEHCIVHFLFDLNEDNTINFNKIHSILQILGSDHPGNTIESNSPELMNFNNPVSLFKKAKINGMDLFFIDKGNNSIKKIAVNRTGINNYNYELTIIKNQITSNCLYIHNDCIFFSDITNKSILKVDMEGNITDIVKYTPNPTPSPTFAPTPSPTNKDDIYENNDTLLTAHDLGVLNNSITLNNLCLTSSNLFDWYKFNITNTYSISLIVPLNVEINLYYKQDDISVSYTHLTLPTNREV